jgi:two-component system chemotaxis sensor kinase CheA
MVEWMEGAALYRLRGQLLPLIFLDRMLAPNLLTASGNALNSESEPLPERDHFIAVLDADGRRFGLVVDGLADPEEIVVKPLSAVLKTIGLYSGATVLGSGVLALILDPGSIATRAGVTMSRAEDIADIALEDEEDAMRSKFLLVEAGERHAAVPLADVLRIERLPLARVEYVGYRPVLNFQGQLLPIEDSAGVFAAASTDPEAQIIVVVCREGNRQVGIAVSHVLDVAGGNELFEAGSQHHASGVTLLNDHVTGIVDLRAIQPLAVGSHTEHSQHSQWDQISEEIAETVA